MSEQPADGEQVLHVPDLDADADKPGPPSLEPALVHDLLDDDARAAQILADQEGADRE